ncbi:hypothetical protein ACRRTK_008455 [Alexandromys fortis]
MWGWNQTSLEDFILQGLFDDSFNHLCLFLLIMLVFLTALVCGDVTLYETTVYICSVVLLLLPIILVSTSYGFILHSVMQMRSAGSKRNTFATCSSHLIVVSLWYGACMFSYMRPRSQRTPLQDKVGSVFYSIITPTLNPLIYTLRNKDVAKALKRVLRRDIVV